MEQIESKGILLEADDRPSRPKGPEMELNQEGSLWHPECW
jgi:hypothetical protein